MIYLLLVLMSLEQKVVSSALANLDTQAMVLPVQLLVSSPFVHIMYSCGYI